MNKIYCWLLKFWTSVYEILIGQPLYEEYVTRWVKTRHISHFMKIELEIGMLMSN